MHFKGCKQCEHKYSWTTQPRFPEIQNPRPGILQRLYRSPATGAEVEGSRLDAPAPGRSKHRSAVSPGLSAHGNSGQLLIKSTSGWETLPRHAGNCVCCDLRNYTTPRADRACPKGRWRVSRWIRSGPAKRQFSPQVANTRLT